jgi:hypothetical protein
MAKPRVKKAADQAPANPWRKLTAKEVEFILKDATSFGEYLATLTVEQIDAYLLLLESDKAMENSSRDSFIALLKELRTDRAEADAQAIMALSPLVSSVQTIQTLDEQIEALERIAKEL